MKKNIVKWLIKEKKTISVAESLTGGLLRNSFVKVSGSSNCFKGSVTAYTLDIKEKVLSVPLKHTIKTDGVDEETAKLMAIGVSKLMGSDYGISTTGIAERWDERKEQAFISIVDNVKKEIYVKHLKFDNVKKDKNMRNVIRNKVVEEVNKFFNDKIINSLNQNQELNM